MAVKRVRARTAQAAKRKSTSRYTAVGSVNYVKGTKRSGMKSYSVRTHRRKK